MITCGETGIRTPDTLLTYTRFPGVPLQPLEHLSFCFVVQNYCLSFKKHNECGDFLFSSDKNRLNVNSKHSLYIFIGLAGNFLFSNAYTLCQFLKNIKNVCTLVSLSAHWDRCHIRTVGLKHDARQGNGLQHLGQMTFLERQHSTDAKNKTIELQQFCCLFLVSRKAMEHAARSSDAYFFNT